MKCLRWNRGVLALISFAVAAQASGQALPSPSPLPVEPGSTFRVLQVPKRAVHFNEIVDLGTLRVREQATYDFLLVPVQPLIKGTAGESLQIGLSADSPAVQVLPSEVTVPPAGKAPFAIQVNAGWLAVGTHVFEVEVTDLNDPSIERPFRIQVTVIDETTIQDVVGSIYERNRRYTVASGRSPSIVLSQFETFRRSELAGINAFDMATPPGGLTLDYDYSYLGLSREGERIVTSPNWRDDGDPSKTEWMLAASKMTFLEAIELESERHSRATRYQVDLSLGGQSRTYTAVALWGGGGQLQLFDFVIPELPSVARFQTQPGLSPTLLADTIAEVAGGSSALSEPPLAETSQWMPESVADQAGVQQCDPFIEVTSRDWSEGRQNEHDHWYCSFCPLPTYHGVTGTVHRECSCQADCEDSCDINIFFGDCKEEGWSRTYIHSSSVSLDAKSEVGPDQGAPPRCAAGLHCAIRYCLLNPFCSPVSLSVSISEVSGEVSFAPPDGAPRWQWKAEWSENCPPCIERSDVTVQVVADHSNGPPFGGGGQVTVQLQVGDGADQEVAGETFEGPTPLHSFGRFKNGLSYGIDATGCLDCNFSGPQTTGTIQGPLNFTLTCSKPSNPCESPEYPVEVDARVRCPGCPEGVEPPPMPSLSATLTAAGQATQQITIGGEGTYPFPSPLPNETDFGVSFSSPSDTRWSCTQSSSGRIFGGPAEVYLTCTFNTPFGGNCNLNPAACNPPPINCNWVWVPFADVPIREVFWESTPDGGTLTEVVNVYTLYWRTIQCSGSATGSRVAGSSAVVGGASAGSTSAEAAPLVVLRNSAQHEFPGPSVPLVGVARDDASTVTGLEVYVDGQQVSLNDLQLNQLDVHTCDEIPQLVPGQPCNYYSRFTASLDVSGIGPGTHHISVAATNADGVVGFTEKYLTIAEPEPNEPNALAVTNHPDSVTVFAGEGTSWSVTAGGGVPPYSYTWEAMGPQATVFEPVGQCCNTSGSTTRILVLNYAESHYDGSRVRCRIEDSAGNTVLSQHAWLWVGEPLQIAAHPEDVTVSAGEDATFSVDVFGGEPPYSYQWLAINPAAPGTAVELAGEAAPTLTIESVGSGSSGNRFLCRVTDSTGETVHSHSALLFVE